MNERRDLFFQKGKREVVISQGACIAGGILGVEARAPIIVGLRHGERGLLFVERGMLGMLKGVHDVGR